MNYKKHSKIKMNLEKRNCDILFTHTHMHVCVIKKNDNFTRNELFILSLDANIRGR